MQNTVLRRAPSCETTNDKHLRQK